TASQFGRELIWDETGGAMRLRPVLGPCVILFLLWTGVSGSSKPKTPYKQEKDFQKYTEIAGATRVGADTCTTCHAETAKDFRHAFHAQQGVECEDCHGAGSLHVQGDVSKIIRLSKVSSTAANGICQSCHTRDESVRHWAGSTHAANRVRCTD